MTLEARISALAGAIRDKINLMVPRLVPTGGPAGSVLVKNSSNDGDTSWATVGGVSSTPEHGTIIAIQYGANL